MDFHILGRLEVLDEGRETVAVAGSKQRALLALLLLHGNETLSTARLIDELWGEAPPATAAKTVQVHVSRLRKALAAGGDGNGSAGLVLTREHGYELRLDPERLDAARFERLLAEGRSELAAGRPERAASTLERGLALWRGPPLADLAYERFAQPEIARLDELKGVALELLIEAKLALGRHAEVIAELETLTREHPYRERLRGLLMLALYRSDRQAEALQAYQDARRQLVAELGIEPGEQLRELERAILAQDPALSLPAAAPVELPAELATGTPIVGRDGDLEWLRAQWRAAREAPGRLAAIVGARGMGKTRLVAELAAEVRRERRLGALSRRRRATARRTGGARRGAAGGAGRARRRGPRGRGRARGGRGDRRGRDRTAAAAAGDGRGRGACRPPRRRRDAQSDAARRRGRARRGAALRRASCGRGCARRAPARGERRSPRCAPTALLRSGRAPRRKGGSMRRPAARPAGAPACARQRMSWPATSWSCRRSAAAPRAMPSREWSRARSRASPRSTSRTRACFFGREQLVAEMVARLAGAPLMGIVGPSGSGKSSALRAGLLAALAAGVLPGSERWPLALLRPGEHPLAALDRATADAPPRRPHDRGGRSVRGDVHGLP